MVTRPNRRIRAFARRPVPSGYGLGEGEAPAEPKQRDGGSAGASPSRPLPFGHASRGTASHGVPLPHLAAVARRGVALCLSTRRKKRIGEPADLPASPLTRQLGSPGFIGRLTNKRFWSMIKYGSGLEMNLNSAVERGCRVHVCTKTRAHPVGELRLLYKRRRPNELCYCAAINCRF